MGRTVPESWLHKSGKVYGGTPIERVTRDELIETIRPDWRAKMEEAKHKDTKSAFASLC